jgi:hypothetical protein
VRLRVRVRVRAGKQKLFGVLSTEFGQGSVYARRALKKHGSLSKKEGGDASLFETFVKQRGELGRGGQGQGRVYKKRAQHRNKRRARFFHRSQSKDVLRGLPRFWRGEKRNRKKAQS